MNRTNNDIMWDCFVDILDGYPCSETIQEVYDFVRSYYDHNGKEVEFNFSHDNWFLVTCWLHVFQRTFKEVRVPSVGHHTKHPMRFIKFLWMKYRFAYPLRAISILDMIIRHGIIRRKTSSGNYHTSGLLLDFYIAYSYNAKIQMFILTKLMKTMFSSWEEVFTIYHGNPEDYGHKVLLAYRQSLQ